MTDSTARQGGDRATPECVHAVADRLHSAAIHLLRSLRRSDSELGLGAAQLSALSVIVYAGPVTQRELAAIEQVRAPTMSGIVRRLEEAGLVTREVDPADRRAVRVHATERGRETLERGRRLRLDQLERRLRDLSADDVTTLRRAGELIERLARSGR